MSDSEGAPSSSSLLSTLAAVARDRLDHQFPIMEDDDQIEEDDVKPTLPSISSLQLLHAAAPPTPAPSPPVGLTDLNAYRLETMSYSTPPQPPRTQLYPPASPPPLHRQSTYSVPAAPPPQSYNVFAYPSPAPNAYRPLPPSCSPSPSARYSHIAPRPAYHPYTFPANPNVTPSHTQHHHPRQPPRVERPQPSRSRASSSRSQRVSSSSDIEMEDEDSDDGMRAKPFVGGQLSALDSLGPDVVNRLDAIFTAYITYLCSHVDATTSSGETIHQALLTSKTEKLDQAGEFRPFRFRIQAFVTGFGEWIYEDHRRHGVHLSINVRHMKEFIWQNKLVARYNYDGKKAKSKGNHVWTIESKIEIDGTRVFRRFERTIVGTQTDAAKLFDKRAHVGYLWSWTPRLWDPRSSLRDCTITFSSPPNTLPRWLVWQDNVLCGIPDVATAPREFLRIITLARLTELDGQVTDYRTEFALSVEHFTPRKRGLQPMLTPLGE